MENLTGILLCGGKSLRMGRDKALLNLREQPMFSYPLTILQQWCSEIMISANDSRLNFLKYRVVNDLVKDIGPMGGLYSCLKRSKNSYNLLLACDMPLITGELLKTMIPYTDLFDAVVPTVNRNPEPLYALYHKRIVPQIENSIQHNSYSLQQLLPSLNVRYIDAGSTLNEFFNANTPAELMTYERITGHIIS
jgi:molybdopterin-guanine dinucleotide biosynthesis protein A